MFQFPTRVCEIARARSERVSGCCSGFGSVEIDIQLHTHTQFHPPKITLNIHTSKEAQPTGSWQKKPIKDATEDCRKGKNKPTRHRNINSKKNTEKKQQQKYPEK